MYNGLINSLYLASEDDDINVVLITGRGKFYSSGVNLKGMINFYNIKTYENGNFTYELNTEKVDEFANINFNLFEAFYKCKVPIIICLNGPAVGLAFTTSILSDYIVATKGSYVMTPFINVNMSPEGLSSYLFHKLLGKSLSFELL